MLLRARTAFLGAAAGVLLLVLVWFLAFHVGPFKSADQSIYSGFFDLQVHATLPVIAKHVADLCDPRPFFFLAAIPVAVALLRRRWRLAVAVGVVLIGANCTTELLKPLLAAPRPDALFGGGDPVGPVSWPSGHATAAMSLALSCVLAASPRLRPTVATLGALFAIAVSFSFLILGWHYPSDVLGGFLIAATWTLLSIGAMRASDARRRVPAGEESVSLQAALRPVTAASLAAAASLCLLLLVRPHAVVAYAQAHTTFVVGAAAIGALAMALATGVMLAVRS